MLAKRCQYSKRAARPNTVSGAINPGKQHVLLVATSYPSDLGDWKGVFIRHIASALARLSNVHLTIWAPPGPVPDGSAFVTTPGDRRWLARLMNAGGIAHLMRSKGILGLTAPLQMVSRLAACYRRERADIYHINWLQCAIPLPRNGIPALVTVLGNDLKLLRSPLVKMLVRRSMKGRRVAICPNAEWMADTLNNAFGDLATISPVSFGIDAGWYRVTRALPAVPIWIAVTRLTIDKLGALFAWSEPLFRGTGRELHLLGPNQETLSIPDWVHYHGAATPEQLARDWFPVAQGLITLSAHAEGRPQVMLEAMAAGLPIVASDMPAHDSIVQNGVTGYICADPESYKAAIGALEVPASNQSFSVASRSWASREYGTWDDCANRYRAVYDQLLQSTND
jgi:hypothetical protein